MMATIHEINKEWQREGKLLACVEKAALSQQPAAVDGAIDKACSSGDSGRLGLG